MRLKRLEKARKVVTTLVVAALSYGLSGFIVRHVSPKFQLTAGTGFTITSTISAWTGCTGTAASLSPTVERCLTYKVHNALTVPITVTSLSITGVARSTTTATHPSCSPALSTFTTTAFTGHLPVPKKTGTTGTNTQNEPITYKTTTTTQTPCAGAKLTFTYHGTAQFRDQTTTTLAAPLPNPATPGTTVTFTATVTATNPTYDTSKPSGTVTFVTCHSATTCTTPTGTLGTRPLTTSTGKATLTTHSLPVGKTYVQATYGGTGTNFTPSTSNIVTEVVGSTCATLTGCLKFLTEPARTQTNHHIDSVVLSTGTPIIVGVVEATGAVDKSFSGTVTVSLIGNPIPPSKLSGTTTLTFVTGVAKFSTLTITHAGSYKLVATASPSVSTSPATSTRFNIDTSLVKCSPGHCTTSGSVGSTVTVSETTTTPNAGYIALGFYGPSAFTCGTPQVKGIFDATVEVLTKTGVSTPQSGTTWTVTYTLSKTIVKNTGPEGKSKWQICWASTTKFTGTGPVAHEQLTTIGATAPSYYVGVLRSCSKSVKAPCVNSLHSGNAGVEIITVQAAGDNFVRP